MNQTIKEIINVIINARVVQRKHGYTTRGNCLPLVLDSVLIALMHTSKDSLIEIWKIVRYVAIYIREALVRKAGAQSP